MNNEASILLPVLTGGLAYRACYGYGGPASKPEALDNIINASSVNAVVSLQMQ